MELHLRATAHVEARAFLSQARDFFLAAESAGQTSRPLLLYYGCLNLAKTLINAKRPNVDLRGAFHGIRESPDNKLAQRFRLTAQAISIQAPGQHSTHILNELADLIAWGPLAAGNEYSVCDLLAQIPAVHRAYKHIRAEPEKLHPITAGEFRFDQPNRQLWALLRVKRIGEPNSRALAQLKSRNYFSSFFSQRESSQEFASLATFESEPVQYAQNPRSALPAIGQRCEQGGVAALLTAQGYRYYLSDVQPAVRIHPAVAAYMAMFYFGSVARYRPAHLEKILKGDYAWAIEEFLSTQAQQFLYFITSKILNREVVRPLASF
jgi:hypothetical protein